jgi:acetyl esterase/lipase
MKSLSNKSLYSRLSALLLVTFFTTVYSFALASQNNTLTHPLGEIPITPDVESKQSVLFVDSPLAARKIKVYINTPVGIETKGAIIYLAGGSCFSPLSNYEFLTDHTIAQVILKAGYDFVIPDYREYLRLSLPKDFFINHYKAKDAILDQISDVHAVIHEYKKKLKNKKLIVLGHSYGGYVVNRMITEKMKSDDIDAYVSSHGIWNPQSQPYKDDRYTAIVPVIGNALPPVLVLLSQNDHAIGDQTNDFMKWLENVGAPKQIQYLIAPGNGHSLNSETHPNINMWMNAVFNFLSEIANQ